MAMKRRRPPEVIPDPAPNQEEALIAKEAEATAKAPRRNDARRELWMRMVGAFIDRLRALPRNTQGDVLAFLMDSVDGKRWPIASAATMSLILGKSTVWCRVMKHAARHRHPCAGGPKSCGRDRADCSHRRGAIAVR